MSTSTRAGFPPTPQHATDSEISGLFRMLDLDGVESNSTLHSNVECVTPARHLAVSDGIAAPADRFASSYRPFDARTSRAFARMARAVAAELNR